MSEKNNVIDQVEVKRSFLGIPRGTVLTYLPVEDKYVKFDESVDVGEGEVAQAKEYIGVSRSLVEDNMGKYFTIHTDTMAEVGRAVSKDLAEEAEVAEVIEKAYDTMLTEEYVEELDEAAEAESNAGDIMEEVDSPGSDEAQPEQPKASADLMLHCSVCGHDTKIADVDEDIAIYMPLTEDARASFVCPNCGTKLDVYYRFPDSETKVEVEDAPEKEG